MGSFGQTGLKQKISCKCTFNLILRTRSSSNFHKILVLARAIFFNELNILFRDVGRIVIDVDRASVHAVDIAVIYFLTENI
jgi:hypothetical protein